MATESLTRIPLCALYILKATRAASIFETLSCKDLGAAGLATLRRGALVHLPAERGGELGMIFVEVASNLDLCRVLS